MTRFSIFDFRFWITLIALIALPLSVRAQSADLSIVNSPHNLSASGPGTVKAAGESQVCIFCHTPHNATPVKPLWNRAVP
ncbi:MAG TPA: hypothetical protein VHM90_21520, partial [Phycisphaerae bacterium]|nr:hypothetical protein [Phycisphaerae bacterium]